MIKKRKLDFEFATVTGNHTTSLEHNVDTESGPDSGTESI